MARVYLETSFISACVTSRRDLASRYRREVSRRWWTRQGGRHSLFVSDIVRDELAHPRFPHRLAALRLIESIALLEVTAEARRLARTLVGQFAMPGPEEAGDAMHVALATLHECEHLLSWNVRHLANINKAAHLRKVCARLGYVAPNIITPEVLGLEDND